MKLFLVIILLLIESIFNVYGWHCKTHHYLNLYRDKNREN